LRQLLHRLVVGGEPGVSVNEEMRHTRMLRVLIVELLQNSRRLARRRQNPARARLDRGAERVLPRSRQNSSQRRGPGILCANPAGVGVPGRHHLCRLQTQIFNATTIGEHQRSLCYLCSGASRCGPNDPADELRNEPARCVSSARRLRRSNSQGRKARRLWRL